MSEFYNKRRFYGAIIFVCAVFFLFIFRLFDWQIINTNYYKLRAASSNAYIMKTDPVRGEILDRNGNGIAVNSIGYKLILDKFSIPKGKEGDVLFKIVNMLKSLKVEWNDNLPIILDKNGEFAFDEKSENNLNELRKYLNIKGNTEAKEYIEVFSNKLRCKKFSPHVIRDICSVYYSTFVNSNLANKINENVMSIISEFNIPGLRVATSLERYYPCGTLAPHIIGYTGLMSTKEYEMYKDLGYSMDSIVGKTGIESAFESELRGYGGKRALQFSKDGTLIEVNEIVEAKPGNTILLTIDSKIQKVTQDALDENIKSAANNGASTCKSAAAVVVEIGTGNILSAATSPRFDLSEYIQDKLYYNKLVVNPDKPLIDRSIRGEYPPGSVFKTVTTAAALQDGLLHPDEKIRCNGSYNQYIGYRLRCTGVHRDINVFKGLARSCNVFYAELGRRLGGERILHYAEKLGANTKTGIEISEKNTPVLDIENSNKYKSGASQAAIGQGGITVSMLQLARITASIALGRSLTSRLVQKVINYSRDEDIKNFKSESSEIGISEENIVHVRNAMREVVLSGLATDFRNYPVKVAAKTGTAQNSSGDDHTTFICYAPFEKPEIAIAVIIANGKHGKNSKNVARKIMNAYFNL